MNDYKERKYLSSTEAAKFLDLKVNELLVLTRNGQLPYQTAGSGQKRFNIRDLKKFQNGLSDKQVRKKQIDKEVTVELNKTTQKVYVTSATRMKELEDSSIHLMVTSPPYFNAKMYSKKPVKEDLGNIHDLEEWFDKISLVWKETFRVLQPGRKAFINIMNLPIRVNGGFQSLNLVGKTVDLMEKIGFIFKRDIIWQKTHGVRAHFGTYPYPGGILINNMHEFILEFNKPAKRGYKKYKHLTKKQKEESRLDKDFWLSIKNSDVWVMSPQNSGDNRSHVAPFPYELPFRLIKAFSFVGEVILDSFLGSGTTLKAAADLKRNGVGYELVPEIADDAVKNLKTHQNVLFS